MAPVSRHPLPLLTTAQSQLCDRQPALLPHPRAAHVQQHRNGDENRPDAAQQRARPFHPESVELMSPSRVNVRFIMPPLSQGSIALTMYVAKSGNAPPAPDRRKVWAATADALLHSIGISSIAISNGRQIDGDSLSGTRLHQIHQRRQKHGQQAKAGQQPGQCRRYPMGRGLVAGPSQPE